MCALTGNDTGEGNMIKISLLPIRLYIICLETVSQLAAPIAPFYMDRLFSDLNNTTGQT